MVFTRGIGKGWPMGTKQQWDGRSSGATLHFSVYFKQSQKSNHFKIFQHKKVINTLVVK